MNASKSFIILVIFHGIILGTSSLQTSDDSRVELKDVRLEIKLGEFINHEGLDWTNTPCDLTTSCDVLLSGYFDTDTPLASWPGTIGGVTKPLEVVNQPDQNVFQLLTVVRHDFTNVSITPAVNFRVEAFDRDVITSDDLIERFSCMVPENTSGRILSRSETDWSAETECFGTFHDSKKVRLTYFYKLYLLPNPTAINQFPENSRFGLK